MKPLLPHFSAGSIYQDFPLAAGLSAPQTLAPAEESPDARVSLTNENGEMVAHAALWWTETPLMDGSRIGTIGGFDALDFTSARQLLDLATEQLRSNACRIAIGPMNGNTWRRHRFVVETNGRGPFLLEPRNPPLHPEWWLQSGFEILSSYSSSLMPLDGITTLPPAVAKRLERSGLTVRKIDLSRYEDELKTIHAISLKAFSDNFLYTPLEESTFINAYLKVRGHTDPDFVMIAERDGITCGFVFGIPDLEAASRGEKPAVIVKTLAVDPASRCAGLGTLLVDELHRIAREKGYTEAIHALQHQTNTSLKITGRHHGEVLRRYALFSKPL